MPRYEIVGADEPILWTQARVLAELRTIKSELTVLNEEIQNSGVRQNLKNYIQIKIREFDEFFSEVKDLNFTAGRGIGDKIFDWQDVIKDIRNKFIAAGGESAISESLVNPPPPKKPEPIFEIGDPSPWGWAIIVGGLMYLWVEILQQKHGRERTQVDLLRAYSGQSKSHKKGQY